MFLPKKSIHINSNFFLKEFRMRTNKVFHLLPYSRFIAKKYTQNYCKLRYEGGIIYS